MTIERSHGKPRPRGPRADRRKRPPNAVVAEMAAAHQDPLTGRWRTGNPGGRMRQIKRMAELEAASLLRLDAAKVATWIRPHLEETQNHVQRLVDGLGIDPDEELIALAGDVGKARLMAAACLTEGARVACSADEARAWREEARAWAREVRQAVLVFRAAKSERRGDRAPQRSANVVETMRRNAEQRSNGAGAPLLGTGGRS